jgi:hypothetical protein
MGKREFLSMFGIYYGNSYHALDPVLRVAYNCWEFYEKSAFNEEVLNSYKRINGYENL